MTLSLLPYDNTCPVVHDNDTVIDVYTEDYLMALASVGDIQLRGLVTSSSITPFNPYVPPGDFESDMPPHPHRLNFVVNRTHGVRLARAAGRSNIPDPIVGIKGHLERPKSGYIEDTVPLGSPGSWLVVQEARRATPDKPLVLVMGGQASIAADAYLLDPSIADRLVVAWLVGDELGLTGYNAEADPWAAYIVLAQMRLVAFPMNQADPRVPKAWLNDLPDSEYRQWLIDKHHPTNELPDERDADGQPAISLIRPDYVRAVRRVRFGGWAGVCPLFEDAEEDRAMVVTQADQQIATTEWWRAMKEQLVSIRV